MTWEYASTAPPHLPSMSGVIGMLFLDIVLYSVIAWYLNNVISGEYGVAKPWNFCFKLSYWGFQEPQLVETKLEQHNVQDPNYPLIREDLQTPKEPVLQICNIRKDFPTSEGTFTAVKGLSMDLYAGELVSLLGRNGAGKTTLISMLTGLYPPTSGDACIYNKKITTDMSLIRSSLGVCPQHDTLWEKLSVKDHLIVFAGIKGTNLWEIPRMVREMVTELKLEEKSKDWAGKLSGGQKRRLCVGMAFIAGSKVIFLDEPTSGLDPSSRRAIWELIKKNKENRVIILTTHFMDEADFLGDRIAIIHNGYLRCEGSSLFLKSRFGAGYTLTLVKDDAANEEGIIQLVGDMVPECKVLSKAAKEISFQLPKHSSKLFSSLFSTIDENRKKIGIDSYGISITTLEEVFMNIATNTASIQLDKNKEQLESIKTQGHGSSFITQFKLLWNKRLLMGIRDWKQLLVQFLIPILIIILAIILRETVHMSVAFYTGNKILTPVDVSAINANWTVTYSGDLPQHLGKYAPSGWTPTYIQDSDFAPYLRANQQLYGAFELTNSDSGAQNILLVYNSDQANPTFLNAFNNIYFNSKSNLNYTNTNHYEIYTSSHPWEGDFAIDLGDSYMELLFLGLVMFAYSLVPSSYCVPLIKERETGVKQLLLISGTRKIAYWLASLAWDMMFAFFTSLLTVIIFVIGSPSTFGSTFGITLALFVVYMLDSTLLSYLLSRLWEKHVKAQVSILMIYFFVGIGFLVSYITPLVLYGSRDITVVATDYGLSFLCPQFALARGIMVVIDFFKMRTGSSLTELEQGAISNRYGIYDYHMMAIPFIAMCSHIFLFLVVLFFVEYKPEIDGFFARLRFKKWNKDIELVVLEKAEENDVHQERVAVMQKKPHDSMILIQKLTKMWDKNKVAVDNLCLSVDKQCFGLLGENGAGKTTTMSMLCGNVIPTSGTAYLNGHNITTHIADVRQSLGYCPQFDALVENMTAREHLALYAELKGIPHDMRQTIVDAFIALMRIEEYADKYAGGYSGGNKRKLSLAIALIASPPILFLDEPTTGMDPVSRRFMWNLISEISKDRAVVLTSHFMEECDALCNRIGILSKGKLKCLGSAQHLKSLYGKGYNMEVKLKYNADPSKLQEFVTRYFNAQLIENHDLMYHYEISQNEMSLSKVFEELERNQEELEIEDYSVNQTTLEQIFLRMSKEESHETIVTIDK